MVGGAVWYAVDYRKKANRRYVIPIEEIDNEDLDAFYAYYKKKRR